MHHSQRITPGLPPKQPFDRVMRATWEWRDNRWVADGPPSAGVGPVGRLSAWVAAAVWIALMLVIGSSILLAAAIAALPLALWALWKARSGSY